MLNVDEGLNAEPINTISVKIYVKSFRCLNPNTLILPTCVGSYGMFSNFVSSQVNLLVFCLNQSLQDFAGRFWDCRGLKCLITQQLFEKIAKHVALFTGVLAINLHGH